MKEEITIDSLIKKYEDEVNYYQIKIDEIYELHCDTKSNCMRELANEYVNDKSIYQEILQDLKALKEKHINLKKSLEHTLDWNNKDFINKDYVKGEINILDELIGKE